MLDWVVDRRELKEVITRLLKVGIPAARPVPTVAAASASLGA
jgi:hypothetical protein